jgi:hypothetical protein
MRALDGDQSITFHSVSHLCLAQHFTRDGTASNLLGIRYTPKQLDDDRLPALLNITCLTRGKAASGSAFALQNYKTSECWPWPIGNEQCHRMECLNYMATELGCGLTADACPTPFARVIHLVQHPVHVIQQLLPKICPKGSKAVHPSFRQMAGVFLGPDGESCLASISWYMVNYNKALLDARKQGRIHAMLHYETSTLCSLVETAGFTDAQHAVYEPNVDKVNNLCSSQSKPDVHKPLVELESMTNDKSISKLPKLDWDDLKEAGGPELVKALKELCKSLGYDPDAPPVNRVWDEETKDDIAGTGDEFKS